MNYLSKFKLKSIKKERYKYWKILLNYENIYKKTDIQDIVLIDKLLKNLALTIEEGELNKI